MNYNTNRILRSPDEDVDLGGIDTSYPRIEKGIKQFTIEKFERRNEGENDFIMVGLKTVDGVRTTDGEDQPPGFVTSCVIGLKPFEGQSQADVDKNLATWVQAAGFGKGQMTKKALLDNPAIMCGKILPIKVGVYKSKKDDSEKNSFNPVVKR